MKALEAFSAKELRTCARILRKLKEAGHQVEDLSAMSETLGRIGMAGMELRFPVTIGKEEGVSPENLMQAAGWANLRSWLKFERLARKLGLSRDAMRAFVRTGHKKWLNATSYGRVGE